MYGWTRMVGEVKEFMGTVCHQTGQAYDFGVAGVLHNRNSGVPSTPASTLFQYNLLNYPNSFYGN